MHDRLVVGFDGGSAAERALRWAAAEAELRGAAVRVVSSYAMPPIVDFGFGTGAGAVWDDDALVAASRQGMQAAAERAFAHHRRVGYDLCAVAETAPVALIREAAEADLVVVGGTGAGAVVRFLLGSVTGALLASSPCPVAIIPSDLAGDTGRVVVGVDGSEHAEHAVTWAAEEATRRACELLVVHVWEHPFGLTVDGIGRSDTMAEVDAALVLSQAVEQANELTVGEVRGELLEGRPAGTLIELMSSADVLVVGARGRGGFLSMLFGSVTNAVAAHAGCPVVVVR